MLYQSVRGVRIHRTARILDATLMHQPREDRHFVTASAETYVRQRNPGLRISLPPRISLLDESLVHRLCAFFGGIAVHAVQGPFDQVALRAGSGYVPGRDVGLSRVVRRLDLMRDHCHVRLVLRVVDPIVASAVQRCHEKVFVGIVRVPDHGDLERSECLTIPGISSQGAFVSRVVPHTIR